MTAEEFAEDLLKLEPTLQADVGKEIKKHAEKVAKTAAGYLGTYQPGWAPLKPETIARKLGGDTPLLETGLMRGRTSAEVIETPGADLTMSIGSSVPYAVAQELGTATIPPRSFLTRALVESTPELEQRIDVVVDQGIDQVFGS